MAYVDLVPGSVSARGIGLRNVCTRGQGRWWGAGECEQNRRCVFGLVTKSCNANEASERSVVGIFFVTITYRL